MSSVGKELMSMFLQQDQSGQLPVATFAIKNDSHCPYIFVTATQESPFWKIVPLHWPSPSHWPTLVHVGAGRREALIPLVSEREASIYDIVRALYFLHVR